MKSLGIVKERHNKYFRWILYIVVIVMLLSIYPLLKMLHLDLWIICLLFALICLSGFLFLEKVVDGFVKEGEIKVLNDSFNFEINGETLNLPFKDIKIILFHPMLGLSKGDNSFKVYECKIKTTSNLYTYKITREEIRKGKLIKKNLINSKAFDLFKFLDAKKINYRFGKRVY